jgi:hypothetical protein
MFVGYLELKKFKNGKQLLEELVGNEIFIYVENIMEAKQLLRPGLIEWLLNQNSKRYRLLINKLIEVFEEIQYQEKERVIEALTNLLSE